MYKEIKITVQKRYVNDSFGAASIGGFYYDVTENESRLTSVKNKSLYDALDEGLTILLGILARKNEKAMVNIDLKGVPTTEGIKQMIADKYSAESEFVGIKFT